MTDKELLREIAQKLERWANESRELADRLYLRLFVASLLGDRVLPSRELTREDELDWQENQRRKP